MKRTNTTVQGFQGKPITKHWLFENIREELGKRQVKVIWWFKSVLNTESTYPKSRDTLFFMEFGFDTYRPSFDKPQWVKITDFVYRQEFVRLLFKVLLISKEGCLIRVAFFNVLAYNSIHTNTNTQICFVPGKEHAILHDTAGLKLYVNNSKKIINSPDSASLLLFHLHSDSKCGTKLRSVLTTLSVSTTIRNVWYHLTK